MSLFHLFSKPKVEKLRGYAEQGLGPGAAPPKKEPKPSKADLVYRNAPTKPIVAQTAPAAQQPTISRSHGTKLVRSRPKDVAPPAPKERPPDAFEPPPLFQAYARATKQGKLEVSTMSPEAVLHKSKHRTGASLQAPSAAASRRESTIDSASIDTRQTAMFGLKPVTSASSPRADLPRKLFVLVNNGYILQYSESGPSNRLPERFLQLGKLSAAFACDVIPGRHHVLQVSQIVDSKGVLVLNSGSVLSRIGIRSHAAKRSLPTLLLVMPNANELDSWMSAIRQQIGAHGGHIAPPEPYEKPLPSEQEEKKPEQVTPLPRRFNLTREPMRQPPVAPKPPQSSPPPAPPAAPAAPAVPAADPPEEDSDTATLDGIEMEASKLDDPVMSRPRATSDAASVASSIAPSVEQTQLDRLRGSARMSHNSTANTVATSRTNSLTSSPPSDLSKASSEALRDSILSKAPYRSLSSYSLANKRRSLVAATPSDAMPSASGKLDSLMQQHKRLTMEPPVEATPAVRDPPASETAPKTSSPVKRLSIVQSAPDLRAKAEVAQKHDSKMPSPVPEAEDGERPVSFVADLPPPSTWASKTSASHRASLMQQAAYQQSAMQQSVAQQNAPTPAAVAAPPSAPSTRRVSLRNRSAFSLPLKVNPQQPVKPVVTSPKRADQSKDQKAVSEVPVVHTLTAKVDFTSRTTISTTHIPARRSSSGSLLDGTTTTKPVVTAKLSLFPSPVAPVTQGPVAPNIAIKRSPSSASSALPHYQPPQPTAAHADPTSLRRPTSLQVRSNPAPFLSSVRNSVQGPAVTSPTRTSTSTSTTTIPIRSLKPSRSVSTLLPRTSPSSTDTFFVAPPALAEEKSADTVAPLKGTSSPLLSGVPARVSSRWSGSYRSSRLSSPLPQMDFGIPIVGLGPPPPPPSAPLPQLPAASSPPPTSPPRILSGGSPPRATGLGIRLAAS